MAKGQNDKWPIVAQRELIPAVTRRETRLRKQIEMIEKRIVSESVFLIEFKRPLVLRPLWSPSLMTKDKEQVTPFEPRFAAVVEAFAKDRTVSHGGTKGFGAGALKVNGKIFAMISSKGEFVVKLPEERVTELVNSRKGKRFDPGRGRLMKEWLVVKSRHASCLELAKEACEFVKSGGGNR